MALFNVTTSQNTLLAMTHNAHAISETVPQNAGDTDFESARETRVHWKLADLSQGNTADTYKINAPIQNGDRIFIRHNNTMYDTLASGVVQSQTLVHPNMTSNTLPSGTASSSVGANAWKFFDGDINTGADTSADGFWCSYNFLDNQPQTIYSYYARFGYHTTNLYYTAGATSFVIEGSMDGTNWSTISTENFAAAAYCNGLIKQIDSPGSFSHYRFRVTGYINNNIDMMAFHLLSNEGNTGNCSTITQGATPQAVFKLNDKVSFNGQPSLVEKDIYYEYGNTGLKLYAVQIFNDQLLDGRNLQTRVDFKTAGNEMTELTSNIFKMI